MALSAAALSAAALSAAALSAMALSVAALSAQALSSASQNFVDVPQIESQAWRRSQHASMGVGSDCLALNLRCAAAPFRDAVLAIHGRD